MSPSATHATRSEGDVTKCHSCHAKYRGVTGDQAHPSAPKSQPSAISATPATQNEGGCHQVPRMPREAKVMSPSATPATQSTVASPATKRTQARPSAPPEPAQCHKCHACHEGGCHQVPRLRREAKVDVTKSHACHAKYRCRLSPSATPATQRWCPNMGEDGADTTQRGAVHSFCNVSQKRPTWGQNEADGGKLCHMLRKPVRQNMVLMLSKIGFAYAPCPQGKAASTPCAVPALSVIKNWVCTRSMPPHELEIRQA